MPENPSIQSFAIDDQGRLLINMQPQKLQLGQRPLTPEQNQQLTKEMIAKLEAAGIKAVGTRGNGSEFGWNASSNNDKSAIFAGEKMSYNAQAEFTIDLPLNDPKTMARIAQALNAPGIRYSLDIENDYFTVKSTINPQELSQAGGAIEKLTEAAKTVTQGELTTAPAMSDGTIGDMPWKADTSQSAYSKALEQAKNATASIKMDYTPGATHDGGTQQVQDTRTRSNQIG